MIAVFLVATPAWLSAQNSYTVTSTADDDSVGTLRWAIEQANSDPGSTITFSNNLGTVALTSALPIITSAVTIDGGDGNAISGGGESRIFFIDAPSSSVAISNLTLADGYAKGGDGGAGGLNGSGGGGLGAGGALFVNAGNVSVNGVTFTNNQAVGGNGGAVDGSIGGGGGGGLGGNGGHYGFGAGGGGGGFLGDGGDGGFAGSGIIGGGGGGGGLIGDGATGSNLGGGGGGGSTASGETGVGAAGGLGGATGGGDGGQSGASSSGPAGGSAGATYGGGGGAGAPYSQGDGAPGGNGGRFGGGGGGTKYSGRGGDGGEFGGGGGGSGDFFSGSGGNAGFGGGGGGQGGRGGFGGGAGGGGAAGAFGGTGGTDFTETYFPGGGGAALGGAIFVRADNGATLTFTDVSADAGSVTAGSPGIIFAGHSVFYTGTAAQALGSAFFLPGGTIQFAVNGTSEIAGSIAEYGVLMVEKTGTGTLIFSADNAYTGGTVIDAGTLQLGHGGASGSVLGAISNSGTLVFDRSDEVTLSNQITGTGDVRQSGTGKLALTGDNTFGGGLVVESGSLALTGTTAMSSLLQNGDGLTLSGPTTIDGTATFNSGTIAISGATTIGGAAIFNAGTIAISGPTTINGTATFNSGATTISGATIFSGAVTLNDGTLNLTAANTLGNTFTVNGGTLYVGHDQALGDGSQTLALNDGATIRALGAGQTISNPLTLTGSVIIGRDLTFTGATTLTADTTVTTSNTEPPANSIALRGIIDGAHSLTLAAGDNAGSILLTGVNTYTGGTTIKSGDIIINSDASLGAASGTLHLDGGQLNVYDTVAGTRRVEVLAGGGTLQTNHLSATFGQVSGAGTLTKVGTGTATFSDLADFTGSLAIHEGAVKLASGGSVEVSHIGSSGSFVNDGTMTFDRSTDFTLGGVSVTGSGSLEKAGTGTLAFGGILSLDGGALVDAGTLLVGSGAVVTLGGISGNGAVKIDGGTLALTSAGSYTGGTTLTSGTLALNAAGALPSGSLTLNGGTLEIGDAAALQNFSGALVFNGGGIRAGGAPRVVVNDLVLNANFTVGRYTTLTGSVTLNADLSLVATNPDGAADADSVFSGVISGNHSLTIAQDANGIGAGAIVLSGANTYTGATTVQSRLGISSDANLGAGALVLDGGILKAYGDFTSARTISLTANGGTIQPGGYAVTFDGVNGSGSFAVSGTGTLRLTGSSTISGNLARNGVSPLTLASTASFTAASLQLSGGNVTIEGDGASRGVLAVGQVTTLSGRAAGQLTFDGGVLRATTTNASFISNFTTDKLSLAAGGGFIDSNGHDIGTTSVFSGTGGLTKIGAGTLTLSSAQTFTGMTTIGEGMLVVTGSLAGDLSIGDGATLGGSGFISGETTLAEGGTIAPGNSPGTLTFAGGLTLASGSSLDFQLGSISDLIVVSGGTLTGPSSGTVTLNLADVGDFDFGSGNTYTLLEFSDAATDDFDVGDFAFGTLLSGTTISSYSLDLSGNALTLTYGVAAIPEPGASPAWIGAAAGLVALAALRRRRASVGRQSR